jgi:hypothetical protein
MLIQINYIPLPADRYPSIWVLIQQAKHSTIIYHYNTSISNTAAKRYSIRKWF